MHGLPMYGVCVPATVNTVPHSAYLACDNEYITGRDEYETIIVIGKAQTLTMVT